MSFLFSCMKWIRVKINETRSQFRKYKIIMIVWYLVPLYTLFHMLKLHIQWHPYFSQGEGKEDSLKNFWKVYRTIFFSGLITHWRIAPGHRRADGVKLIGCDICDAFNIVNGFRDEESVESHTKHVHGEVREHSLMTS